MLISLRSVKISRRQAKAAVMPTTNENMYTAERRALALWVCWLMDALRASMSASMASAQAATSPLARV